MRKSYVARLILSILSFILAVLLSLIGVFKLLGLYGGIIPGMLVLVPAALYYCLGFLFLSQYRKFKSEEKLRVKQDKL